MNRNIIEIFNKKFLINSNGKIKLTTSNRYVTANEALSTLISILEPACIEYNYSELNSWIAEQINKAKSNTQESSVESFVMNYLNTNKGKHWNWNESMTEIEYSYKEYGSTSPADLDQLLNVIKAENIKFGSPFKDGDIKTTLNVIQFMAQQRAIQELISKIKYDSNKLEFQSEFLHALYDYLKPKESYEIFSTLLKHWAWQVKRKLNNRTVINHIWLNFYGATGLGKTQLINRLCNVMSDLISTCSISKLFDDTKEIKRLTEKYILNFDELGINSNDGIYEGKLTSDQLAILKSIITGDKLDTRVYGTQNQSTRRITFSCISSANEHLYDIIYDSNTMRRFFEFNCTGDKPESYDEINIWLNRSVEFWQSIDEDKELGYWDVQSDIGKIIQIQQKEYFPTKTTVVQWLNYYKLVNGSTSISNNYQRYKLWCKGAGYNSKSLSSFIEEISKRYPQFINNVGLLEFDVVEVNNVNRQNTMQLEDKDDIDSFFKELGVDLINSVDSDHRFDEGVTY